MVAEILTVSLVFAALCLPGSSTLARAKPTPPPQQPLAERLMFDSDELIKFELRMPWKILSKDRYGKSTYHAAELSYLDASESLVVLPVEVRTRGKTRRRREICPFPPLKIRFGAEVTDAPFHGQRSLKLVTHCRDKDSFDQYVLQEYLAYRVYNQLTERGHRARLARVTYLESDGRLLTARYGIFLESRKSVATRNGLGSEAVDGAVDIEKLNIDAANRVAVFQYLIGNDDWSMLWPEPQENCCHNTKPLLAPDGTVVPLPYDFDFAGIVNPPYAVSRGGSSNVRVRRYRGLCSTQAQLDVALRLFVERKPAIYALYREQRGVSQRQLNLTLKYLDGFYRVIADPKQVERRMIRRCKIE